MKEKKQTTTRGSAKGTISEEVSPSDVEFDASVPLENDRHEMFCHEFSVTRNRVRSYLNQYPSSSYNAACSSANDLLRDPKIQARADYLLLERMSRVKMSADEVIAGLSQAARFDPAELMNPDGSLIPINQLPPEVRLCIEKIEVDEIMIGEGANRKNIGRTAKIHVMSKLKAYEMLGRNHKLFTDKIIHEHKFSLEEILSGEEVAK
ncbi:MAG: hypothetical protein A2Y38_16120 [Spirochaetes bacterium GWB1_59_5]|nr:MAG: hypothetical protein A2Y38_16120 [Spirochaetes bacterium GWB1_59_5]